MRRSQERARKRLLLLATRRVLFAHGSAVMAGVTGASSGFRVCWLTLRHSCHILVKGEGRNDPFSVLKTFLEEPPEVVIYDFACALEEYASNRDPWWFRNTLFLIDRFHWPNHTA